MLHNFVDDNNRLKLRILVFDLLSLYDMKHFNEFLPAANIEIHKTVNGIAIQNPTNKFVSFIWSILCPISRAKIANVVNICVTANVAAIDKGNFSLKCCSFV